MPIQVTCTGCHKRFQVSDKFAGKEGPCPHCKTKIRVPDKNDEVVIHEPEAHGPKDSSGKAVLEPIKRTETRLSVLQMVGIGGAVLTTLVVAVVMRSPEGNFSPWLLGIGAVILGPPLALAGYSFLRNDELEPYRGLSLLLRCLICGVVYAVLWAGYAGVRIYVFEGDPLEVLQMLFVIPPLVLIGGVAPLAALELDYGTGLVHYGLYLLVTIVLSLIMGVPLI